MLPPYGARSSAGINFHFKDGFTQLEDIGSEFPDIGAVRNAAITTSGELLRDGANQQLWDGTPWRMW